MFSAVQKSCFAHSTPQWKVISRTEERTKQIAQHLLLLESKYAYIQIHHLVLRHTVEQTDTETAKLTESTRGVQTFAKAEKDLIKII